MTCNPPVILSLFFWVGGACGGKRDTEQKELQTTVVEHTLRMTRKKGQNRDCFCSSPTASSRTRGMLASLSFFLHVLSLISPLFLLFLFLFCLHLHRLLLTGRQR
jgi:hypothetical protein